MGHSPRQAGGDTEQVHDVAGVAVLAENHLQNTEGRLGSRLSEWCAYSSSMRTRVRFLELMYVAKCHMLLTLTPGRQRQEHP